MKPDSTEYKLPYQKYNEVPKTYPVTNLIGEPVTILNTREFKEIGPEEGEIVGIEPNFRLIIAIKSGPRTGHIRNYREWADIRLHKCSYKTLDLKEVEKML